MEIKDLKKWPWEDDEAFEGRKEYFEAHADAVSEEDVESVTAVDVKNWIKDYLKAQHPGSGIVVKMNGLFGYDEDLTKDADFVDWIEERTTVIFISGTLVYLMNDSNGLVDFNNAEPYSQKELYDVYKSGVGVKA